MRAQHAFVDSFISTSSNSQVQQEQDADTPSYWACNPSKLLTSAVVHSLHLGTGDRVLASILPVLERAETEIIFVTCYWARSSSQAQICETLRKLSANAMAQDRKIRVRICFSSSGIWQKLFHTQSPDGKVYSPDSWKKTLGLPGPEELEGLDLEVKSIFILPISIIHPKFIVVDRKHAFLPSCNVSWENWFEGCVELSGPVVRQFVRFWQAFWAREQVGQALEWETHNAAGTHNLSQPSAGTLSSRTFPPSEVQALFLPSPHHRNPRVRLPWQAAAPAPSTPLNVFLLQAFELASKYIYIQTPNVTSQPAIDGLLAALDRGVDVNIVTSERLQLLEQIITAGTTSPRCVENLTAEHRRRREARDIEVGRRGRLKVSFYKPRDERQGCDEEPVQSHFKLTVVDGEMAVFGSGNMDRPSWYTSQELGVAFFSNEFVRQIEDAVSESLEGRLKQAYHG